MGVKMPYRLPSRAIVWTSSPRCAIDKNPDVRDGRCASIACKTRLILPFLPNWYCHFLVDCL